MAHLTNFSFEFFYEIFTEDAFLLCLYHGAKKSKTTKKSNQGGPALRIKVYAENVGQGGGGGGGGCKEFETGLLALTVL